MLRDQPVILYCRSGTASGMAAAAPPEAGFDAHNIAGGLEAWFAEGRRSSLRARSAPAPGLLSRLAVIYDRWRCKR
jgi:hypothetical protein